MKGIDYLCVILCAYCHDTLSFYTDSPLDSIILVLSCKIMNCAQPCSVQPRDQGKILVVGYMIF